MAKGKPHMNIVFIGHVDHGKSTTVGRLLYDTGNVDEQTMRKLKERAKEVGRTIGQICLKAKIDKVVFDRNGFKYTGRIKLVADEARAAGLKF